MSADLNDPDLRDRAVAAARGQAAFDVLLTGGQLVDVITGEIRPADIGLVGPLVASVHDRGARDDARVTDDLCGGFVTPGLIDAHMHIESSMTTPRRYAETVVPQGTTGVVWDPHEVANVAGLDGVRWALDASRDLPLEVMTLAPSCVPSAPGLERAGARFDPADMASMLKMRDICGVAEVMDMRGVLERSARMRGIVDAGLASAKLVCGHARGLAGADLQAFAAAGIGSDHELTDGEDFLGKLRAGFTIELRGSHDYVLPEVVAALKTLPRLPSTVTICTDDVFPDDLVARGGMSDVLRRLVGHGMPPIDAVQCATLNAAHRLGREDLGRIAPGRRANIAVFRDMERFEAVRVYASGHEVARDGQLVADIPAPVARSAPSSMHLEPFVPEDFTLRAEGPSVQVTTVAKPRFTEWSRKTLQVVGGKVVLGNGMIQIAVMHRHGQAPATPSLGILDGWGRWTGAVATTVSHDSHNLVVFGRAPEDMVAAANALITCGGGMAVARAGRVTACLPLPVFGLLSDASAADTAECFRKLKAAAEEVADWAPPLRTFKALVGASLACNPGPHVTDLGIADGLTGEFRPLFA
ncbi:Adenine deaminase 2 [Roseivivax jejudonensis]|uniref:Adenine deaminase n=1 Tax=Roseivivax jejudonensis TaxID=1529041 RepID=A0A1X7A4X9_9RHOB|nr:adenine deaminase C-terminal domain-containing protein [Roseivivax jejudonensis]SLN70760.1 Adenine deaminase 2 [Roseivivax jejudonensis]